jgi:hypothetical protein
LERIERWESALITVALFRRFHTTESKNGSSAGFVWGHATEKILLGEHRDVRFEFGGPFGISVPAREAASDPLPHATQGFHRDSPSSVKKRAMISVVRCQWHFSERNSFRPALVRR